MPRWFVVALVCAPGCLNPVKIPTSTSTGESTDAETSSGGEAEGSSGSSTSGSGSGSGEESSDAGASSGTSGESESTSGTSGTSETSETTGDEPVCGDGKTDPPLEECDDGPENGQDAACTLKCVRRRTVFITSEEYTPKDIGGLYFADSFCRQLAQASALDRYWTYVAWLSDSTISANERLFKGRGPYVRVDGVQVTKNAEQFLSGQLDAPIIVTEIGAMLEGAGVWTGTLPDGSAVPGAQHCDDWSSEGLQIKGHYGLAGVAHSWWTYVADPEINPAFCLGNHLYCIEGE